jgi:tRNA 2-thiouridine synthesizing protein A
MTPQAITSPTAILVDARGLACPLPALRLARAVREHGSGRYRLLADDPAAAKDIPALAAERGWRIDAGADQAFEVEVR